MTPCVVCKQPSPGALCRNCADGTQLRWYDGADGQRFYIGPDGVHCGDGIQLQVASGEWIRGRFESSRTGTRHHDEYGCGHAPLFCYTAHALGSPGKLLQVIDDRDSESDIRDDGTVARCRVLIANDETEHTIRIRPWMRVRGARS